VESEHPTAFCKTFPALRVGSQEKESLMIWQSPIMGIFPLLTASVAFLLQSPSTRYMSTKSENE
jgi:hypothetical protein